MKKVGLALAVTALALSASAVTGVEKSDSLDLTAYRSRSAYVESLKTKPRQEIKISKADLKTNQKEDLHSYDLDRHKLVSQRAANTYVNKLAAEENVELDGAIEEVPAAKVEEEILLADDSLKEAELDGEENIVKDQDQVDESSKLAGEITETEEVEDDSKVSDPSVEEDKDSPDLSGDLIEENGLEGDIEDGWIKINYNDTVGYIAETEVNIDEITETEVPEEIVTEEESPEQEDQLEEDLLDEEEDLDQEEDLDLEEELEPEDDIVLEEDLIEEPEENVEGPIVEGTGIEGLINESYSLVGTPYVWAGSSYDGFDCSGLTSFLYQKYFGLWIGRQTTEQVYAGYPVDEEGIQPGDLLCFQNPESEVCDHVGIYLGNDLFIHAATEERGVVIDSFSGPYVEDSLISIRRIINN